MGNSAKRLLLVFLDALLITSTLFVLLVLFTGSYEFEVFQFSFGGWNGAYSIIFVLVLLLLRQLLRKGADDLAPGLVLFCLVLIVYLSNGRTISEKDSIPARYLPLSILQEGNFDLDEFDFLYKKWKPYYLVKVKEHYVSFYPVGAPILAVPFYAASALGGVDPQSDVIEELEKISASVLVALSVLVFYKLLLLLTTQRYAIVLALIYAFATSSFSSSSQALWQHGPSQLALTAALYSLFRGQQEPKWLWLSGFLLSVSIICRPTDLLIALPIGIYVLFMHRQHFLKFALCGIPPALFQLIYNFYYFGNAFRMQFSNQSVWRATFAEGFAGILISPARGLFVYSPIFLFSLIGFVILIRRKANSIFPFLGAGVVLIIFIYSKWRGWWGGSSFGPRLLSDITPLLVLFLYPLKEVLTSKRLVRIGFICLAVFSVIAHSIGVFDRGMPAWNARMNVDHNRANLWLWDNNQLVNPIYQGISRAYIALSGTATTRSSEGLAAEYWTDLEEPVEVSPYRRFEFRVRALNTGKAVWIGGQNEPGSVRLKCTWLKNGKELRLMEIARLVRDVPPGDHHEFDVSILSPRNAGTYTLKIDMFTDSGNFSDHGVSPLLIQAIIQ